MGNYPCALQQHDRVLSVYERVLPPKDPRRIKAMGNKANALRRQDKLDESLALYEAAVELGRQVFERDSDDLLVLEEHGIQEVVKTTAETPAECREDDTAG